MVYTLVLVLALTSGPSERLYVYNLTYQECTQAALWATSNIHKVKNADTMTAYCDKSLRA